jgi:hypothetical protein
MTRSGRPRCMLLLVQAGPAVDAVVQQLLEAGIEHQDRVVECGNRRWTDTIRARRNTPDGATSLAQACQEARWGCASARRAISHYTLSRFHKHYCEDTPSTVSERETCCCRPSPVQCVNMIAT